MYSLYLELFLLEFSCPTADFRAQDEFYDIQKRCKFEPSCAKRSSFKLKFCSLKFASTLKNRTVGRKYRQK